MNRRFQVPRGRASVLSLLKEPATKVTGGSAHRLDFNRPDTGLAHGLAGPESGCHQVSETRDPRDGVRPGECRMLFRAPSRAA